MLALINLGLLCGHVGRFGSGLNPLRGQNNVQGGGDMGAIPNKLPGFQDIERDDEARKRFEQAWETTIRPQYGWHLTQMFHGMERGELRALYVIGENPAQSEADINQTRKLLAGLDCLVVQDIVLTRTAEMADVVFPSAASWCEAEGTVTNSERRVQRVRKALEPPGEARDDMWIIAQLAKRLGHDWGDPTAEQVWDELRSLSPMHAGMSYARLEEHGGLQWPCPDEQHPGFARSCTRGCGPTRVEGPLGAVLASWSTRPPFEAWTPTIRFGSRPAGGWSRTTPACRRAATRSPLHRGESLDLSPEDAERLGSWTARSVRVLVAPRLGRRAGADRSRRCVPGWSS